jgi:hypothetical protein
MLGDYGLGAPLTLERRKRRQRVTRTNGVRGTCRRLHRGWDADGERREDG